MCKFLPQLNFQSVLTLPCLTRLSTVFLCSFLSREITLLGLSLKALFFLPAASVLDKRVGCRV